MNNGNTAESSGSLVVQVSTARGAIPLSGAVVKITGTEQENSGVLYTLTTDEDGKTPRIALPAPKKSQSYVPGQSNYSSYNIEVTKEGFNPIFFHGVPVYEGITSIQPAVMIPLLENTGSQNYVPDEIMYYEYQNPNI